MPFELPENWTWSKLGNVCDIARGGSPRPIKEYLTNEENGINWIKIGDAEKGGKYINSTKEKIRPEGMKKSRFVHKGDFLLTNSMSFGHPYILNIDGCIHDGWLVISPMANTYATDFMYYLLSSKFAYNQFAEVASGGVVTNLNSDKVADSIFPMPPFAEQHRIVAEIERWFTLIDIIKQEKEDLQTTIKQAKSKILDLAIHGKLVSQDPNDEPASELLKRINPKAEITCDNGYYPFKIPINWIFTRGDEVFSPMKNTSPKGNTFTYLDIESINNKNNTIISPKTIEASLAPSRASRYTEKGDVLFSMVRPYLRNIAIVEENDCIASTGFYVCHANGTFAPKFCYYLMLSSYVINGLNTYMKGDNSPSINKSNIDNYRFPLPPLSEQYHIVAKIEELFSILDSIQNSLEA